MLACAMASEEESEISPRWATDATAKAVAEAETWRSWVVLSMIISIGKVQINANEWNIAYRSEIIYRHRGNRGRDSVVVMGCLIDGGEKWSFKMLTKLTPVAGTLTGGRSPISKLEAPKLWAVCSISQYLKIGMVKLNTHTFTSGKLGAWSRIRVTSRNGWHEISGASACRCRSCRPWPLNWTLIRFLGLESFVFLISTLHIVDARWMKGKDHSIT